MTDATPRMTSHRPYLLRALNEWIADNGMTPHLLVDATQAGVQVPASAVKEGKVVLNIAERAVVRLLIDNEAVSFTARFGGVSQAVYVPVSAVLAIYSRETGQGMALPDDVAHDPDAGGGDDDPPSAPDTPPDDDAPPPAGKRPPFLRVVK
ncbi:MAG TPA: ClpXP protease specificity-enhancing factor [Pseudoxanthomonas sp.]|uniref:ClpXP protease specificity-enhancing factor n=1 Tax=Pseudoxanthomonas sp. SE1 TaxID=1664560 RepID=UPI00240E41D5|nr:ClpXP protease specificity-enhancing factor [Pseudoxanthomonas sp. SE1]WFC42867.1 ClpXP protease specificity-enhancing factor [Pseudoxanthomonas sp. SE1]HJS34424.1 ClpXP protease specificity-enhancing factor [Pseudoxanthomonas sp.]